MSANRFSGPRSRCGSVPREEARDPGRHRPPRRLGTHFPVDVGVVGDATTTANTMKDWLADAGVEPSPACSAALEESLAAYSPANEFEDGGFMMGGLQEFNTLVRHRLDLITVVINDGGYGAEYHHVVRHDLDGSLPLMSWPDFAAVATSLGGTGITVRSLAELETAARAITERDRPLLLDIRVNTAVAAASMGL